jgi:hypothetical protein
MMRASETAAHVSLLADQHLPATLTIGQHMQESSSYNDTAEHLLWQHQTVLECQVEHNDPQVG